MEQQLTAIVAGHVRRQELWLAQGLRAKTRQQRLA